MDDLLTLIIESENTTERKIKLIKDVFNLSKDKKQSSGIQNPFTQPTNPPFGKHEIMFNGNNKKMTSMNDFYNDGYHTITDSYPG